MTVHRAVRNYPAPSEREFSSGFTGSFVLAHFLPDSIAVGNKNPDAKRLRFGVMQAMVITIADTSKLKRLQTCNQATAFPSISAFSFSGKYRGCFSLERAVQVRRQRRGFALPGIRRFLFRLRRTRFNCRGLPEDAGYFIRRFRGGRRMAATIYKKFCNSAFGIYEY